MNQPTPVADARRNQIAEVRVQLQTMTQQFADALPSHIPAKQFTRVVLTGIQNNPDLLECDRRSLWNACMRAAEDGLLPDGRHGALVVFKDKRRGMKVAQWMPMIAGIRQKIRNSGEVATLDVEIVRERDHYEYERGDNPHILHRPTRGQRGPVIAAYSIAKLKTGEVSREWMWVEEIEDIRKRSRAADSGPWVTDYGEMCKKTVAKRHSKVLPMSTDVLGLLNRDEGLMLDRPASATATPLPPEPRALTDALNLLAGMPDQQSDERPPYKSTGEEDDHDETTGEVIEQSQVEVATEAPADQTAADLRAEHASMHPVDPQPAQQPRGHSTDAATAAATRAEEHVARMERDTAPEIASERLKYLGQLNDAATAGLLDSVYKRFPKQWQRELEADYKSLKFRGEANA
jgi:recombination protein RecT